MASLLKLLERAAELDVTFSIDNGQLSVSCTKGTPPADLLAQLDSQKVQLQAYIRSLPDRKSDAGVPRFRAMPAPPLVPSFRHTTWNGIANGVIGVDSMNCHIAVRTRGPLSVEALQYASAAVVVRHKVLGVQIVDVGGCPHLSYERGFEPCVEILDLSAYASDWQKSEAQRLASKIVWQPMDLRTGPLFKVFVIKLGREDHVLGLLVHHFVADKTSFRILVREFSAEYQSHVAGHPSRNPPPGLTYKDYLLGIAEWLATPTAQAQLEYWQRRLGSAPGMLLPAARGRPAATASRGAREYFHIGASLAASIDALACKLGTTVFTILLCAQKMLLANWTKESEITIGGLIPGRELPILEATVGYLADRVYWRTSLAGDPTFAEIVLRVTATVVESMQYPFIRSDIIRNALLRVGGELTAPIFNFIPAGLDTLEVAMGSQSFESFPLDPAPSVTPPTTGMCYWMALVQGRDGLHGHIRYSGAVVAGFLPSFLSLLERVAGDCNCRLSNS